MPKNSANRSGFDLPMGVREKTERCKNPVAAAAGDHLQGIGFSIRKMSDFLIREINGIIYRANRNVFINRTEVISWSSI